MQRLLMSLGLAVITLSAHAPASAQYGLPQTYSQGFRTGNLPNPDTALVLGTLRPQSLRGATKEQRWHDLAARMADRVWSGVHYRRDLLPLPIKVRAPDATPFSLAFSTMLTSELVSRGLVVAVEETARSLPLSFHGVVVPGPCDNDALVLTMSLWHGNEQVIHVTNAYEVEKAELGLYHDPNAPRVEPIPVWPRTVRMRSK